MKELQVSAIKDGVVIDHIHTNSAFKLVELLHLKEYDNVVTFAFNLESKTMDKKALIKISGRELTQRELDKIAVIAPHATVNIIKDYEVIEKAVLELPDVVENIIKCNNHNCITNHEKMETSFKKIDEPDGEVSFKCHYCERILDKEEIEAI